MTDLDLFASTSAGYCPGPALVSLATLTAPALASGVAMLAGMRLHRMLAGR